MDICVCRYLWAAVALSYYAISFNAGNLAESVYLRCHDIAWEMCCFVVSYMMLYDVVYLRCHEIAWEM